MAVKETELQVTSEGQQQGESGVDSVNTTTEESLAGLFDNPEEQNNSVFVVETENDLKEILDGKKNIPGKSRLVELSEDLAKKVTKEQLEQLHDLLSDGTFLLFEGVDMSKIIDPKKLEELAKNPNLKPIELTDLGKLEKVGGELDLENIDPKVLKKLARNPNLKPINLTDGDN